MGLGLSIAREICRNTAALCVLPVVLMAEGGQYFWRRVVANHQMPVFEFRAEEPNRGIIRTEAHLLEFRRQLNAFLMFSTPLRCACFTSSRRPPLCASVEIARMLLPEVFEVVHA